MAGQNVHQSALAGAVFTDQSMDFSSAESDIDLFKRPGRTKALADIGKLDRSHSTVPRIILDIDPTEDEAMSATVGHPGCPELLELLRCRFVSRRVCPADVQPLF